MTSSTANNPPKYDPPTQIEVALAALKIAALSLQKVKIIMAAIDDLTAAVLADVNAASAEVAAASQLLTAFAANPNKTDAQLEALVTQLNAASANMTTSTAAINLALNPPSTTTPPATTPPATTPTGT